jgi:hypothetical protein
MKTLPEGSTMQEGMEGTRVLGFEVFSSNLTTFLTTQRWGFSKESKV